MGTNSYGVLISKTIKLINTINIYIWTIPN